MPAAGGPCGEIKTFARVLVCSNQGSRPKVVSRPRAKFFLIRTDQSRQMFFYIYFNKTAKIKNLEVEKIRTVKKPLKCQRIIQNSPGHDTVSSYLAHQVVTVIVHNRTTQDWRQTFFITRVRLRIAFGWGLGLGLGFCQYYTVMAELTNQIQRTRLKHHRLTK